MTIETKFNVGDEVWFMRSNRPETALVTQIIIMVTDKGFSMNFAILTATMKELFNMNLRELFKSKADLLNSL